MQKLAITLAILLASLWSQATTQERITTVQGTDITGSFAVSDQFYSQMASTGLGYQSDFVVADSRIDVRLKFLDEDRTYYSAPWTLTVNYDIDLYDATGSTVSTVNQTGQTLTISYDPTVNYRDIVMTSYNGFQRGRMRINSVSFTGISATPSDVVLDLVSHTDRYLTLSTDAPIVQPEVLSIDHDGLSGSPDVEYSLKLAWNYITGAERYDVEWVFVDVGDVANLSSTAQTFDYHFRDAIRINTSHHYYEIPLTYPAGVILYRVRPVGVDVAGGQFDKRVNGTWSVVTASGSNHAPGLAAEPNAFAFNGMEIHKNWGVQAIYTEEGKRQEMVTYYDGNMKSRQTMGKINSDNNTLISEQFYDHQGRPALAALSVPTEHKGYWFQPDISNGFGMKDYDLDANFMSPDPFDPTSTITSYYSNNLTPTNANYPQLPNAEGYTYGRSLYRNDGTDRLAMVSNVGKDLTLGSGRETKYFYGTPGQKELDRLFGNEAGYAGQYKKNMVIDPNGHPTITYHDLYGNLVARCIADESDAHDNLLDVDFKPNSIPTQEDLNIFSSTNNEGEWELNYTFLVPSAGTYTFNYSLGGEIITDACINDVPCFYDVYIALVDECDQVVVQDGQAVLFENEAIPSIGFTNLEVDLLPGSYTAKKIVKINPLFLELTYNEYVANHLNPSGSCYTFEAPDPVTSCNPSCIEACLSAFVEEDPNNPGIYIVTGEDGTVWGTASFPPKGYNLIVESGNKLEIDQISAMIANCVESCTAEPQVPSECEIKRNVMVDDMTPGGQYFENLPDQLLADGSLNPAYQENGWLSANITIAQFQYATGSTLTSWPDIRANWDESWDLDMLPFHPEYAAYDLKCGNCNGLADGMREFFDNLYYGDGVLDNSGNILPEYDYLFNPGNSSTLRSTTTSPIPIDCAALTEQDYHNGVATNGAILIDPFWCCPWSDVCGMPAQQWANQQMEQFMDVDGDGFRESNLNDILDPAILSVTPMSAAANTILTQLHGPGGTIQDDGDRLQFFWSVYSFFRGYVEYNHQLVNIGFPVASTDNPLYNDLGFLIRCMPNSIYEAFDCNGGFTINNLLGLQQSTHQTICEGNVDEWIDQLVAQGCVDLSTISPTALATLEQDLITACTNDINNPDFQTVLNNLGYGACSISFDINQPAYDQGSCECSDLTDLLSFANLDPFDAGVTAADLAEALEAVIEDPAFLTTLTKTDVQNWVNMCASYDPQVNTIPLHDELVLLNFHPDMFCADTEEVSLGDAEDLCTDALDSLAYFEAWQAYEAQVMADADAFLANIINTCMDNLVNHEILTMDYSQAEYFYTLYYYDRAHNLVKTVQPSGVNLLSTAELSATAAHRADQALPTPTGLFAFVRPNHDLITKFKYNSWDQMIEKITPDGGKTTFYYDPLGRAVASQNAEQALNNAYTYFRYDHQSRIIERGEIQDVPVLTSEISRDPEPDASLNLRELWFNTPGAKFVEVTRTQYEESFSPAISAAFGSNGQEGTRNRVASMLYYEFYNPSFPNNYTFANHYSYDLHGNIKTLVNEYPELDVLDQRFKKLEYTYEVISGNVLEVAYQAGEVDQFYQRHCYDKDNRLTESFSSVDGKIWERESKQLFYPDGALARTELGDKQVQASDPFYTIQSWLKGVNSSTLKADRDLGHDGQSSTSNLNASFARDAMAFSLGFFEGDYEARVAGLDHLATTTATSFGNQSADLYNGNISTMITSLAYNDLGVISPLQVHGSSYRYDQLGRVRSMDIFKDESYNGLVATSNSFADAHPSLDYQTEYHFDIIGNFTTLKRNGISQTGQVNMDEFEYFYYDASNNAYNGATAPTLEKTNKLAYVTDDVGATFYPDDIDDMAGINYSYDALGQLKVDLQEQIANIVWTRDHLVRYIIRSSVVNDPSNIPPNLEFVYDANRKRVAKIVKPRNAAGQVMPESAWKITYYVRDVEGSVIATYQRQYGEDKFISNKYLDVLELTENHVYGAGRVALYKDPNRKRAERSFTADIINAYELVTNDQPFINVVYQGSTSTLYETDGGSTTWNPNTTVTDHQRELGHKSYECTNHLDNVMEVILDRKLPVDRDNDNILDFYQPHIVYTSDYYPYGMPMYGGGAGPGKECISCGALSTALDAYLSGGGDVDDDLQLTTYLDGHFTASASTDDYREALEECSLLERVRHFNATPSNYVDFGKHPQYEFGTNDFTVEAWINIDPSVGSGLHPIVANQDFLGPLSFTGVHLGIYQSNIVFIVSDGSGYGQLWTPIPSKGEWHHIVAERIGNNAYDFNIYIDGVLQTGAFVPQNTLTDGDVSIDGLENMKVGSRHGSSDNTSFLGEIREVRIYQRQLANTEITGNYNNGCEPLLTDQTSLVLWAPLDEGSGNTSVDKSSYAAIGTHVPSSDWVISSVATASCPAAAPGTIVLCAPSTDPLNMVTHVARVQGSDEYRYGFNGQEHDDEIKGPGNSVNYTFRMYDPRLGRFFAMDPYSTVLPSISTYCFAGNSPVAMTDQHGGWPNPYKWLMKKMDRLNRKIKKGIDLLVKNTDFSAHSYHQTEYLVPITSFANFAAKAKPYKKAYNALRGAGQVFNVSWLKKLPGIPAQLNKYMKRSITADLKVVLHRSGSHTPTYNILTDDEYKLWMEIRFDAKFWALGGETDISLPKDFDEWGDVDLGDIEFTGYDPFGGYAVLGGMWSKTIFTEDGHWKQQQGTSIYDYTIALPGTGGLVEIHKEKSWYLEMDLDVYGLVDDTANEILESIKKKSQKRSDRLVKKYNKKLKRAEKRESRNENKRSGKRKIKAKF